jgi:alpha-L-fucosidase
MTMNRNWGFNRNDSDFKSAGDMVRKLIDVASKGGNFLLNIGPKADGTFPQESIDRLAEIGRWMRVNGEAVHGTTASPVGAVPWGRVTAKEGADRSLLYLHVFDWPSNGKLTLQGLANGSVAARLMAGGEVLKASSDGKSVIISLPAAAPDPISSTVVLEIKGLPKKAD